VIYRRGEEREIEEIKAGGYRPLEFRRGEWMPAWHVCCMDCVMSVISAALAG